MPPGSFEGAAVGVVVKTAPGWQNRAAERKW